MTILMMMVMMMTTTMLIILYIKFKAGFQFFSTAVTTLIKILLKPRARLINGGLT